MCFYRQINFVYEAAKCNKTTKCNVHHDWGVLFKNSYMIYKRMTHELSRHFNGQ